jgi:hypothetical protein
MSRDDVIYSWKAYSSVIEFCADRVAGSPEHSLGDTAIGYAEYLCQPALERWPSG